jgi:2-polyprenyl-3-methyl-5-hydroxy-6-metoxy-1,4-benzoquinol methylase
MDMSAAPTVDRFAFGKNWQSFAAIADEESISEAQRGLVKLFPNGELRGARILDVGCGSGLSMVAALRLGASHVHGVDIDPNSTSAAHELLSRFDVGKGWSVETATLFDLPSQTYDVVYSWGVLHHTGAMWRALERVTTFVRPGGLLAVAIYRRSPACGFWQKEKRFYSSAPDSPLHPLAVQDRISLRNCSVRPKSLRLRLQLSPSHSGNEFSS